MGCGLGKRGEDRYSKHQVLAAGEEFHSASERCGHCPLQGICICGRV